MLSFYITDKLLQDEVCKYSQQYNLVNEIQYRLKGTSILLFVHLFSVNLFSEGDSVGSHPVAAAITFRLHFINIDCPFNQLVKEPFRK